MKDIPYSDYKGWFRFSFVDLQIIMKFIVLTYFIV